MARRRAVARPDTTGTVPPELYDVDAPAWQSTAAALAWCEHHDVQTSGALAVMKTAPGRLRLVIPAYAAASGHEHPRFPNFPDSQWLRETGLDAVKQRCTRQTLAILAQRS